MTDLRFALRSLRKTPEFTSVAVLTLALGIGANVAIFSIVHTVLLKPLPYREPARLVAAWDTYIPQFDRLGLSITEFDALRQQREVFGEAAWYRYAPLGVGLTAPGVEAVQVNATFASPELFSMLGVAPAIGRVFTPADSADSVVLSDELWRSRFAGDRGVVGRSVRLNGEAFTIIGVMPPQFRIPDFADVWLPNGPLFADTLTNPVRHGLAFLGRLAPGATQEQAAARVQSVFQRLAAEHPQTSKGWGMKVAGLQDDLTGSIRPALLMLFGATGLVLLIACANVANLLLSRAGGRSREIAVRTALGAGAWRIARQLITESMVLAATGAALGLSLAAAALRAFSPVAVKLDGGVLLFLVGVALATGMLFGLTPAFEAVRGDPFSVIKSSTRGGSANPVRGAIIVAEVALALMLAAGAGMLVKSYYRLMRVEPGFEPRGVLTLRLNVPPSRDPASLFRRMQERLGEAAGVESVASVNMLPLAATTAASSRFNVPGSPLIEPNALPAAQVRPVSTAYFTTMRIPLRSGRMFSDRDLNQPVVIVNESFAKRYWPGRDPVGEKFITGVWGPQPQWSTVVGVVGDVRDFGLDAPPALCEYFPGTLSSYLVVRGSGDPRSLAAAVRRGVHEIDAEVPVSEVRTMDDVMAASTRSRRWTMALLAAFAALALVLALVGIYGVMAWAVAQRTREIGIRMALGGRPGDMLRMVVRRGATLSAIGIAIGLAGAMGLRHVAASFVFGISPVDAQIYAAAILLMLAVAVGACVVPALRASRVDPGVALRWE